MGVSLVDKRQIVAVAVVVLGIACAMQGAGAASFDYVAVDAQRNGHCSVADIDGDGLNDIVAAFEGLAWYRAPSWQRYTIVQMDYESDDIGLADIDGDGDKDGVGISADGALTWLENPLPQASALSASWTQHPLGQGNVGYVKDVECADMNGDGRMDVVVRGHTETSIFTQSSAGSFSRTHTLSHPSLEGMALGDIDGDEDIDIVLNGFYLENPSSASITRWTQHVIDNTWYTGQSHSWATNNAIVALADINRDGRLDALFGHSGTDGYPVVWCERGAGADTTWTRHVLAARVDYCQSLDVMDVDGDGDVDVLTAVSGGYGERGKEYVTIHYNANNGASWTPEVVGTSGGYSLVLGDIDNDGDGDVVGEYNHGQGPIQLFRNPLNPATAVQQPMVALTSRGGRAAMVSPLLRGAAQGSALPGGPALLLLDGRRVSKVAGQGSFASQLLVKLP